ncbi:MAG: hydrogenase iron-sulfur subunit [Methanomassiliicoccales archaeon]|nr:MAG: hydrogenase iron-sulfur subunit [Methanomassiliicoccales archaeon]
MEKEDNGFNPKIVGFLCNWCSYAGADLAGVSRFIYPPNLRIIRVMCSGSVDPAVLIEGFLRGADGILVCGCHPGDCHYQDGNSHAARRIETLRKLIQLTGLEPERLRMEWVSASEGKRFAEIVTEFVDTVTELGPNPVAGDAPDIDIMEGLYVARSAVDDFRLSLLMNKEHLLETKPNAFNRMNPSEKVHDVVEKAMLDEYARCRILLATKGQPQSVKEISERANLPEREILGHIVLLRDRGLVTMTEIRGISPLYLSQIEEGQEISTLPLWAKVQKESIETSIASLPDVDEATKKWIVRELLLTLRCYNCERRRSNVCHFSVCVRGLLSGVVE